MTYALFSINITLVVKTYARVAQLVERHLAKVEVAGSSPVSRSYYLEINSWALKMTSVRMLFFCVGLFIF